MRSRFWSVSILVLVSLAVMRGAPPVSQQAPVGNIGFRFTTDEAFDASSIPPYTGRHDEVYAHIDKNLPQHLAELQRWVRQPSVSAQNRGIAEMANVLAGDLKALGFKEVALVPTAGHPGVFAFYDAGAPKTLAIYMMYDVQPEETGWSVPAFDGAVVDLPAGRVLRSRPSRTGSANRTA